MIHDRNDCAPLRRWVIGTSVASWLSLAYVFVLVRPDHELQGAVCGPSLWPWLSKDWVVSVSMGWLLMVAAMMWPTTLLALVHIRINTFTHRRLRASLLFLFGYSVIWLVAGLLVRSAEKMVTAVPTHPILPAVGAALIALGWQFSPLKQRCLNRCHAYRPLAAFGLKADTDACRMGLGHGVWCVGSCWALMLFTVLLPQGHLAAMLLVSLLMLCERLDPPATPCWRLRGSRTAAYWLRRLLPLRLFA
jgi:predicted metal-binding membrane protein